jgi:hypothetical protein
MYYPMNSRVISIRHKKTSKKKRSNLLNFIHIAVKMYENRGIDSE